MLREIPNARQVEGEPHCLWFFSHEQDLLVWYDENGTPVAFQLCYGKYHNERALRWKIDRGFTHEAVDDGENFVVKEAPILVAAGIFDATGVLKRFIELSQQLPPEIVEFISQRLREHPSFKQTSESE